MELYNLEEWALARRRRRRAGGARGVVLQPGIQGR